MSGGTLFTGGTIFTPTTVLTAAYTSSLYADLDTLHTVRPFTQKGAVHVGSLRTVVQNTITMCMVLLALSCDVVMQMFYGSPLRMSVALETKKQL